MTKEKNQRALARSAYEPGFKKIVVDYAYQNSNRAACIHFGISESNIRRWKRLSRQGRSSNILSKSRHIVSKKLRAYPKYSSENDAENSSDMDTMPLQQRLSNLDKQHSSVLQSEPLSPTKLKVTRQASRPPELVSKLKMSPMRNPFPNEEVCLKWNSHHSNIQQTFPNLLKREQYVDVTLAAEGRTLKCHRMILSACSPYLEEVLSEIAPYQHPVLFLKDIRFECLKALCEYMYIGEVNIFQNELEELLTAAKALKIKGLGTKDNDCRQVDSKNDFYNDPPILEKYTETRPRNEKKYNSRKKNTDAVLDPLDLMEPVYEELASPAPSSKSSRKNVVRKWKKRRISDDESDSAPSVFQTRKGTRSRPNVKVPKFYHAEAMEKVYCNEQKKNAESLPVLVPATSTLDEPMMDIYEIKTESIDFEDDMFSYQEDMSGLDSTKSDIDQDNFEAPLLSPMAVSVTEADSFKKINLEFAPQATITSSDQNETCILGSGVIQNECDSVNILEEFDKLNDPLELEKSNTMNENFEFSPICHSNNSIDENVDKDIVVTEFNTEPDNKHVLVLSPNCVHSTIDFANDSEQYQDHQVSISEETDGIFSEEVDPPDKENPLEK